MDGRMISRSLTRTLREPEFGVGRLQIHSNEVTDQCLPAFLHRNLCKGLGLPPGAGYRSKVVWLSFWNVAEKLKCVYKMQQCVQNDHGLKV